MKSERKKSSIKNMLTAVGSNIITGANGKIKPRAKATRAEAASMIYKYLLATKDF